MVFFRKSQIDMRQFLYPMVGVLMFLFSDFAYAQSAKEAVTAFTKLEARIETGISYRDYVASLGDLNFELKSFADSPESKKLPEFQKALDLAMLRYIEAKELWGLTFGRYGTTTLSSTSDIGRSYLTRYPDAAKKLEEGGATFVSGGISIEYLLSFLWKDAAQSVAAAKNLLPSQ